MIASQLKRMGLGLSTGFNAINPTRNATGASSDELRHGLEAGLGLGVCADLAERLVAWGDTSGDGRMRAKDFARILRATTGYGEFWGVAGRRGAGWGAGRYDPRWLDVGGLKRAQVQGAGRGGGSGGR